MLRILFLFAALLTSTAPTFASTLTIRNNTDQDIINILVINPAREIFLRLDLLPHATDTVENPDCIADLRVDTGQELWYYKEINLTASQALDFCAECPACLIVESDGTVLRVNGTVKNLTTNSAQCRLDNFSQGMQIKDVCPELEGTLEHDDNGALLTTLNFSGFSWAARIIPAQPGPANSNSQIEHLELRRHLDKKELEEILRTMFKAGYLVRQMEFPVNFSEATSSTSTQEKTIAAVIKFLDSTKPPKHKDHAAGEKCEEAFIQLTHGGKGSDADISINAQDYLQVLTFALRPCTDTLLLDVAAYHNEDAEAAQNQK